MQFRDWWLAGLLAVACGDAQRVSPVEVDLRGLDPEVAEAVQAAQEHARVRTEDPEAAFELAAVLEANELDQPAEAAWLAYTALAPQEPRGWYHLAIVRERRGEAEGALNAVRRTLELADGYGPAHARLGRLHLDAGRLEEAEAAFRRALELEPDSPAPIMGLARVALLRRDADAVVALLEPLVQRLPREPYAHGLLARARALQGRDDLAQQELRAEAEAGVPGGRDPWQAEVRRRATGLKVRLDRAKRRLALGDPAGAWAELEPLASRSGELAVLDAQCQVLTALGRPEQVLARIDAAPQELRESSMLAVKRVLALRELGRTEEALAEVEAEIRRNPAHPYGHALRGGLLLDLDRPAEAAEALAAARARNDESLGTWLDLARALGGSGDWAGAAGELERAARAYPAAPKPWAYRSEYLALEGHIDEARASLREAQQRGLEPELVERVATRIDELAQEDER
jgi:predicted Zn-dependent protease